MQLSDGSNVYFPQAQENVKADKETSFELSPEEMAEPQSSVDELPETGEADASKATLFGGLLSMLGLGALTVFGRKRNKENA